LLHGEHIVALSTSRIPLRTSNKTGSRPLNRYSRFRFIYLFFDMFTQEGGEMAQTSDICFMKRGVQPGTEGGGAGRGHGPPPNFLKKKFKGEKK
jgi:hypothetical protein